MPIADSRKKRIWGRLTEGMCPASKTYFFFEMWRKHWSLKASQCRGHDDDEGATYAESRSQMPPGRVSLVDGLYCELGGDCMGCCAHSWPRDQKPSSVENFVQLVMDTALFETSPVEDPGASFAIETSRQNWETTKHELLFAAAHRRRNVAILTFWLAMIAGAVACLIPESLWMAGFFFVAAPVWMIVLLHTAQVPKGPAPAKKENVSAKAKGFSAG